MKVETALQTFYEACQVDGVRPSTLKWYSSILNAFAQAFQEVELTNITPAKLRSYILALRERDSRYQSERTSRPQTAGGLSEETVASHVRALHRFWRWCALEYALPNPMANIRRPRLAQREPKAISLDDLRALFAATTDDIRGIRDRAILAFFIDTGCRAQGLLGLELEQLHLNERSAIVQEKGTPRRAIFFTEFTANLLMEWLKVRPDTTGRVFCSLANNAYGKPLSHTGLYGILRRLKKAAGVNGRHNPHAFRHGFAREYLTNGGDLATLAQLMGHSSVTTTASYYAVFSQKELARNHDRFSPAKGLEEKKV